MSLLQLTDLSLQRGGRILFEKLSWTVPPGQCVGLVGPNGSGKSSLLRVIAGLDPVDAGRVERPRDTRVGYLAQDVELGDELSLWQAVAALPPALAEVEAELLRIEARLADSAIVEDAERLERVLAQQESALERYEEHGGPSHEGRVRSLLGSLGFSEADHETRFGALSGGQKKLAGLARVALEAPDLMLLDEPDNHLDLAGKERLERFVAKFAGSTIVVSHDRYLLDSIADSIAELAQGKLTVYRGNYSAYAAERELRRARQAREHELQQREIARLEEQIRRFELWASIVVDERHMKQARSRRKKIERMDRVERPRDVATMGLALEGGRGSRQALVAKDLGRVFGDEVVFAGLDFMLEHGQRIGLVGANGAGKSVLLKLLVGRLEPSEGRVMVGPSSRLGYYAQEHETLDPWAERSPLELVRDHAPVTEDTAVRFLMRFAFGYEQIRHPIARLSGGERSRLQLARLMLGKPNVLVLDEPTNHLDLPSAEVLESALDDFEGALLVVSHDRYFLDRSVDTVIEIADGDLHRFEGGYTDYRAARGVV